jgi:mRNA-degrading endonuclease toxin of MazEF toxin-antitoxin module
LDTRTQLMVVVLSNSMHLQAQTGRVICCPYLPGARADDAMPLVIAVTEPSGTLLPELIQWLPLSALGEPLGNVGPLALSQTSAIVTALISGQ